MAAPGEAFPAGDPRNAEYFEQTAKLEKNYTRGKTERENAEKRAITNSEYGVKQVGKQEPEGFRQLRNRANKGGILHSGIAARRTGNLQTQYAAKRYGFEHGLQETKERLAEQGTRAKEEYEQGLASAGTRSLAQGRIYAEEHPPAITAAAKRRVGGKYITGPKGERIYQAWS